MLGILIEDLFFDVCCYNFFVVFVIIWDESVFVWVDILIGNFLVMVCDLIKLSLELVCFVLCEVLIMDESEYYDIIEEFGVVVIELGCVLFDSI